MAMPHPSSASQKASARAHAPMQTNQPRVQAGRDTVARSYRLDEPGRCVAAVRRRQVAASRAKRLLSQLLLASRARRHSRDSGPDFGLPSILEETNAVRSRGLTCAPKQLPPPVQQLLEEVAWVVSRLCAIQAVAANPEESSSLLASCRGQACWLSATIQSQWKQGPSGRRHLRKVPWTARSRPRSRWQIRFGSAVLSMAMSGRRCCCYCREVRCARATPPETLRTNLCA